MPGPRLPAQRPPTVPRFTLRRPPPTVAPRNKRNGTEHVRRTAGNLGKRIRNLPRFLQNLERNEAQCIEELKSLRASLKTRLPDLNRQKVLLYISLWEDNLIKTREALQSVRNMKNRINTYKVPSLTLREPTMKELMGPVKTNENPKLPGVPEETNSNNE